MTYFDFVGLITALTVIGGVVIFYIYCLIKIVRFGWHHFKHEGALDFFLATSFILWIVSVSSLLYWFSL